MRLIHACIVVPFMAYKGGDGKGRSYKISMKHNNNMKHNDKRRSRIRGGNMRDDGDKRREYEEYEGSRGGRVGEAQKAHTQNTTRNSTHTHV